MDILTNKKVITRKSHLCHGCATSYPSKSEMRYTTSVDAGEIGSAYWCKTCDEVISQTYDHYDLQDGIQFGSVKDGDIAYWEGVKYSILRKEANEE